MCSVVVGSSVLLICVNVCLIESVPWRIAFSREHKARPQDILVLLFIQTNLYNAT